MEYIDLATWDRREYFNQYLGTDFPYINIGAHLNITNMLRFSKKYGLSSYLTMIFASHKVAEGITNFRYRIKDGKPVVINDRMYPRFTHIPKGRDLFINVTVEPAPDVVTFNQNARKKIELQGDDLGIKGFSGRLDLIMYSAIPWIQYTHFIRTIAKSGVDSIPKISWGKYFNHGDQTLVPFSVQVHHGLMDGFHVGRYFEELQIFLDQLSLS